MLYFDLEIEIILLVCICYNIWLAAFVEFELWCIFICYMSCMLDFDLHFCILVVQFVMPFHLYAAAISCNFEFMLSMYALSHLFDHVLYYTSKCVKCMLLLLYNALQVS